ncbi:MAG: tetratricopeptide repeat protein [Magnetospiraceae bacterium]
MAAAQEMGYADCMDLARADGDAGFDAAVAWEGLGGGLPARHCQALALITLGHYGDAGLRLEAIAKEPGVRSETVVSLLAQAGQAWLLADRPDRALEVQIAALDLAPEDAELRVDRAQSHAALKDPAAALQDLNAALDAGLENAQVMTLRAAALRQVGRLEDAHTSVEAALAMTLDYPPALLERGLIAAQKGDKEAARKNWLHLLSRVPEEAPEAAAARGHLERMDVTGAKP